MNFLKVLKFDFINTIKNYMFIVIGIAFPILIIAIFGYLTKVDYGASDIRSYDYYGIAGAILLALVMSQVTANTFMEKRIRSTNIRVFYSPTSNTNIYMSKTISSFLFGSIIYIILMLCERYILNINLGGFRVIYVSIVILLFMFFICSLGTFLCCLLKSEEATNKILFPINALMGIFGGAFFPISSLGPALEKISNVFPVKWILQCSFAIIYDNDFSIFVPVCVSIIAFSVILLLICKITFKPEEYI